MMEFRMRRREALLVPVAAVRAWGRESLALTDSYGDGFPDFLRLRARADQEAFRGWTVWLAESVFVSFPELPADVVDCAALLRFCYREALRRHDGEWARAVGLRALPPLADVREARYPAPRLRDRIFRVRGGPFREADLGNGAFRAFADAEHLMRRNAFLLGRELGRALPGDLLFFKQLVGSFPFHSMVWTGEAAVYHTGPLGRTKGEMRRLTRAELVGHREARWRPQAGNDNFLGVYRWNILRDPS
jgi:uncharacterized protein